MPKPKIPARINTRDRRKWQPILTEMGPHWHRIYVRCVAYTRRALVKRGLAEFKIIGGTAEQYRKAGWALFGRLTGLGVAVRDRWISADAEAEDKRRRAERDK
jgi:hypothetical protein